MQPRDFLMKTCSRCKQSLPRTSFAKNKQAKDGLTCYCRECKSAKYRALKAVRPEIWGGCRQRQVDSGEWAEYQRAFRSKNKLVIKAYNALHTAIRRGEIERPSVCQECGAVAKIHAHHHDYTRPLDVLWLCDECHGKEHRELNSAAN